MASCMVQAVSEGGAGTSFSSSMTYHSFSDVRRSRSRCDAARPGHGYLERASRAGTPTPIHIISILGCHIDIPIGWTGIARVKTLCHLISRFQLGLSAKSVSRNWRRLVVLPIRMHLGGSLHSPARVSVSIFRTLTMWTITPEAGPASG